ncbi:MAG: radical SAM protein [Spirochaetales bacterium]|nr:radical SAM protein [Spirochaetales bacterium]
MEVQTLSIVVPAGCYNRCRFCVSRLHDDSHYINQIEKNKRLKHLYRRDYMARLAFARDNGCNTIILTGRGEPILNPGFLENLSTWNQSLEHPFRWMELQTAGAGLDREKLKWLRNEIKIATISVSLSSIFSDDENADYNRTPDNLKVDIASLCREIKELDFNLRLSLNMTDFYNGKRPEAVFERALRLGADQLTFRVLYKTPEPDGIEVGKINEWIDEHRSCEATLLAIKEHIVAKGKKLERLPFGALRYSVSGISTVLDDDCMNVEAKEVLKYLILRPNCKLYTKWDDPGSLLF